MAIKLVRFDWALKKLLRHKANFDVTLESILESEVHYKEPKVSKYVNSGNKNR